MDHEQRIARATIPALIRAIAAAEGKAAVARAWGKDARPAEHAAAALRTDLARVSEVAEGRPSIVHRDPKPENMPQVEDAGAAAEAVVNRLARTDRVRALRQDLASLDQPLMLRWPGLQDDGAGRAGAVVVPLRGAGSA